MSVLSFGDGVYGYDSYGGEAGVSQDATTHSLYDSAPMGMAPGSGPNLFEKPRRRGLNQTGPVQNTIPYHYGSGKIGGGSRNYDRILESDEGETLLTVAEVIAPTIAAQEAFIKKILKDNAQLLNGKEIYGLEERVQAAKLSRVKDDIEAIMLLFASR